MLTTSQRLGATIQRARMAHLFYAQRLYQASRPLFSPARPHNHKDLKQSPTPLEVEDIAEHVQWNKGGGIVHKLAVVDTSSIIEVGAVVQAHARVGPYSQICSGSVVGPHVTIGSSTILWYSVALQNCSIGNHCTIHNNASVGQDGFGFFVDEMGQMVKKPQTKNVIIGDHVEIGAGTCIDRGSWRDTVIGDHTKIDNQVQIGHNTIIGKCSIFCGQVGIGGSCTLGDYVVLGGKVGVADHVSIVSKARIAAMSGVTASITEPGDYGGFPAVNIWKWRRSVIMVRKLTEEQNLECLQKDTADYGTMKFGD